MIFRKVEIFRKIFSAQNCSKNMKNQEKTTFPARTPGTIFF